MYHLLYNLRDSDYYLIDTRTSSTSGAWYHSPPSHCYQTARYANSVESTLAYFAEHRPDWPLVVVASSPSTSLNFHLTHPELYL